MGTKILSQEQMKLYINLSLHILDFNVKSEYYS